MLIWKSHGKHLKEASLNMLGVFGLSVALGYFFTVVALLVTR